MSPVTEKADIRQPPHYEPGGPQQTLTPDTARQAPRGQRVLWVLLGGTLGVIAAFAIAYFAWLAGT